MTEQFSQPVPPEKDDDKRDRMIRHAQYLIDGGFIKGVPLDKLIKKLEEGEKKTNLPEAGRIDTFSDLEDFE